MKLKLNESQMLVLRWIAEGADEDTPPVDAYKVSALALQNRALVKVSRRGGTWGQSSWMKARTS